MDMSLFMLKINNKFLLPFYSALTLSLLFFVAPAPAQIAEDALLVGRLQIAGTARVQGLAGTGYALGGDASAAYLNPAGLGFYNRSSVVFTPNFNYVGTTTNYEGTSADAFMTRFNVSNFGIIINNTKDDVIPSDFRGGSFGITYNAVNTIDYDYNYGPADNLPLSIIDEFVAQSNGIPISEIDNNIDDGQFIGFPEAAYFNFLINPDPATGNTYIASIPAEVTTRQEGDLTEKSRLSQWNFAYGGNYKDMIYFGATVGFRNFSYLRENEYRETYNYPQEYIDNDLTFFPVDDQLSIQQVDYVQLNETLRIDGSGINASLGIIYRPIEAFTIGLNYQTPTFYSLTNEEYFDLFSRVLGIQESDTSEAYDIGVDEGDGLVRGNRIVSDYSLTAPSRLGAGLAYFFEKYGFITADIEYVNFTNSRFSTSENFSLSDVNEDVDRIYKPVVNYRVGGELRLDMFRLRAGYAMNQDPTNFTGDQLNRDRRTISAGVGIYSSQFFADLTVSNTQYESDFPPYLNYDGIYYPQEIRNTQAMLTLGFNF